MPLTSGIRDAISLMKLWLHDPSVDAPVPAKVQELLDAPGSENVVLFAITDDILETGFSGEKIYPILAGIFEMERDELPPMTMPDGTTKPMAVLWSERLKAMCDAVRILYRNGLAEPAQGREQALSALLQ